MLYTKLLVMTFNPMQAMVGQIEPTGSGSPFHA